jgi:hypothetical protein
LNYKVEEMFQQVEQKDRDGKIGEKVQKSRLV